MAPADQNYPHLAQMLLNYAPNARQPLLLQETQPAYVWILFTIPNLDLRPKKDGFENILTT